MGALRQGAGPERRQEATVAGLGRARSGRRDLNLTKRAAAQTWLCIDAAIGKCRHLAPADAKQPTAALALLGLHEWLLRQLIDRLLDFHLPLRQPINILQKIEYLGLSDDRIVGEHYRSQNAG